MLVDADLAEIYGVSTKALNQAVKRNAERFPEDFRFQLTAAEREEVVTNCDHLTRLRFSPVLPWAFTEHGSIMAASVLNSQRAVEMSAFVVRAFVRLRDLARTHAELARHLAALERRVAVLGGGAARHGLRVARAGVDARAARPGLSPGLRWFPVVTMLQLAADMALGSAPPGFGHERAPSEHIDGWVALTEPEGWTEADVERLRRLFRQPRAAG